MKRFLSVLAMAVMLVCSGVNAQNTKTSYQPKTISEAVFQLNEVLSEAQKADVRGVTEEEFMLGTKSALAKWVQQNWLYTKGTSGQNLPSALRKYMVELDVVNDEDMADVILRTFYRWFNNTDLGLQEQVAAMRNKSKK